MEYDRQQKRSGENYSWLICAACMLLIICTMGTCTNAFSVYLPYIAERGLSESAVSMILSVRCGFSLIGMLLVPLFYRHLSLRLGMTLSCLMAAFSFILYALADTAPLFYAAASLAGLGYGLGSLIPASMVINRWFKTNRGFAMGLCTAGTGISTIAFPPLITYAAERFGMDVAFLSESIFLFVSALLVWLILRDTPEEVGRRAYAKGKNAAKVKTANHYNLSGLQWPLIFTAVLMLGGVSTAAPGHFPALFSAQGYGAYAISLAVSLFGVLLAVGKLVYGKAADLLGGEKPSLGFLIFLAAGCVFCCVGNGGTIFPMFLGAALMGFGFPLASVGLSVLAGDFADESHYMSTLKWLQIAYAGGGMLLSPLPGILFERFGTYALSYALFFVMAAMILIALGLVYHHRTVALHGKHHHVPVHPLMRIAEWFSFSH